MTTISDVEFLTPLATGFQWGVDNVFYIHGTGLAGGSLTQLAGKVMHSATDPETGEVISAQTNVNWQDFGTLDNSDDSKMKVHGTPVKPFEVGTRAEAEAGAEPYGRVPTFEVDPGSVTPTVTVGGNTFSNTLTASYSD